MNEEPVTPCWICEVRPSERPQPANDARTTGALLESSLCAPCRESARPYEEAWQTLGRYLEAQWTHIIARGSFDLSKVFSGNVTSHAIRVHLFFVKVLGCKLKGEGIDVDLKRFATALLGGAPHPEVFLMVVNGVPTPGQLLSYRSDVSVLRSGTEVQSALWMNLAHPVAIKICYLKQSAPVGAPPGFPWHPLRQRKVVKISPYKGDTEPSVARRDLRI